MDFIKPFNEATADRNGENLTVHIFIHQDNSMTWRIVGQSSNELIKQAIGVQKGSAKPHLDKLTPKLTASQLRQIAERKAADSNTDDMMAIEKMIAGTARSMGVEVEESYDT